MQLKENFETGVSHLQKYQCKNSLQKRSCPLCNNIGLKEASQAIRSLQMKLEFHLRFFASNLWNISDWYVVSFMLRKIQRMQNLKFRDTKTFFSSKNNNDSSLERVRSENFRRLQNVTHGCASKTRHGMGWCGEKRLHKICADFLAYCEIDVYYRTFRSMTALV